MRKLFISLSFVFLAAVGYGQTPQIIHMNDLDSLFEAEGETLYVINFWATWCRPCVAELPFFDVVQEKYADQNVKVLLVSLDFADDMESRVLPFLERRGPKSEVLLLDEANANDWIDKVSKEWTGAIPATIFVQKSKNIREFHEGDFSQDDLNQKVETLLQH